MNAHWRATSPTDVAVYASYKFSQRFFVHYLTLNHMHRTIKNAKIIRNLLIVSINPVSRRTMQIQHHSFIRFDA